MFGLRHINNNYKEHAGSRSDFIITGHPEYQNGRVESELKGFTAGWDTERRMYPAPHMARTEPLRMGRKARSAGELVHDVSDPAPRLHFQERSRTRKDRGVVAIEKPPGHSFEQFWEQLVSDDRGASASASASGDKLRSMSSTCFSTHVGGGSVNFSHRGTSRAVMKLTDKGTAPSEVTENPFRTTASIAGATTWANACRHFSGIHDELLELRRRARRNPEAVKKELLQKNNWKFYAGHLEQAQRLEVKFERERKQKAAVIMAAHLTPAGVNPRGPIEE